MTYDESALVEGLSLRETCVNCHTFANNNSMEMLLGVRSNAFGDGTLLVHGKEAKKLQAKFGYTAWHPSGRIAVYTTSIVRQFFHAAGPATRDAVDMNGDLAYYSFDAGTSKPLPRAAGERRLKSYPTWSPDGRHLYYCTAPLLWGDQSAVPPARYAEVKYDLVRIGYDVDKDEWSEPETVLSSAKTRLSVVMPRISPDGRFLLFCMCRYGCFPAFQSSSDLYMMDLSSGSYAKAEASSEESESWHSWSSNSRWIAFSSKRGSGHLTRCYFSYVDETGRTHKPFLLPESDPEFYQSSLRMINLPELVTTPVCASRATLARRAVSRGDARGNLRGISLREPSFCRQRHLAGHDQQVFHYVLVPRFRRITRTHLPIPVVGPALLGAHFAAVLFCRAVLS